METLTPSPAAGVAPQTLAAGELVWAKAKGRPRWWPAILRPASLVSCFGDAHHHTRRATSLRPFSDPAADDMARHSAAHDFVAAVEEAHAHAVALLCDGLTCACARPPSPSEPVATAGTGTGTVALDNLPPSDFLASLHGAALDVSSVGLLDRARLKSWTRALAQGWGPAGPGYYPRRMVKDLEDKVDLDLPAGEDRDWGAVNDGGDKPLERPQETPMQKKRSVASLMEDLHPGEGGNREELQLDPEEVGNTNNDSGTGSGLSGKRQRKKSKYLSPPYTNLGTISPLKKEADSPKESTPHASHDDKKALPDNADAPEVLLVVTSFGKNVFHRNWFPKSVSGFLGFFRSSVFAQGADHGTYEMHECSAEKNVSAKAGADDAGLFSGSCATPKQGNRVLKRGRKKDQDGSAGSSVKKRKREKASPAASPVMSITPAIPIRQVKAEDIRSLMAAGGSSRVVGAMATDAKTKLVFKSPISAAESAATKLGQEQGQENGGSVVKAPEDAADTSSDKCTTCKNDEGMLEAGRAETGIHLDINAQHVITDVPTRSIPREPPELGSDVPAGTSEQNVAVDVSVRSGSLPMRGDTLQPADDNNGHASVEVHTVQESYASLEAMVPEAHKKVDVTNGTDVIPASHVPSVFEQKGEHPIQQKTAEFAIANHPSVEATNGACPDQGTSAPKKKKKKATQHYANPGAVLLKFHGGVVVPTREELLSTFRKFGFVIESETEIRKETRSARVVFAKSVEAEAACRSELLGMFGDPFAEVRLDYPPAITVTVPSPSPASKPPLVDIRKNLEKMISSLSGHSPLKKSASSDGANPVSENHLMGEMQGLLAKVDKMLSGPSTSTHP